MGSVLTMGQQQDSTLEVVCKLVTDNTGQFAGLAPVEFVGAAEGRAAALQFARKLVYVVDKGFDPHYHSLKIPGVPTGAVDVGLHCNTHTATFNGGPLSAEQVELIQSCTDTFTLTVSLKDFAVLVGSPSNDDATGVIGYVGLLITQESLPEYNRAVAVYGGKPRDGNIPHVSICGWVIRSYSTTTEARAAFGLITRDGERYSDGELFYTANVFPSMILPDCPIYFENTAQLHYDCRASSSETTRPRRAT